MLSKSIIAQLDTIWYNSDWKQCDRDNASFYRPKPILTDSGYWVKDYYLSGKLQYQCLSQNIET